MDLDDLDAFLAVVRTGSVATAAETLGVPRSTLRRRLDELETRAGVPLLLRSHLGVQLSPAGEVLAHRGRLLGEQYNALIESVREEGQALTGVVRLALPVGMPGIVVADVVARLTTRHPELVIQTVQVEDPLTVVPRGAHAAVHVAAEPPSGPWAAVAAGTFDEAVWADRTWIERHGAPTTLAQLKAVRCAAWSVGSAWPLRGGGHVELTPSFSADDADLVEQVMRRSGGVAWLPEAIARRSGALAPVLPRLVGRLRSIWLVAPQSLAGVARIREALEAAV